MLNDASGFKKVYLAIGTTDLRKGIDGLAAIAYSAKSAHPFRKNGAPFRLKLSSAQLVD